MESLKFETDCHFKLWVRTKKALSATKFVGSEQAVVNYMTSLLEHGATIHGCQCVTIEDRFDLVPSVGKQKAVERRMIADVVDFESL